MLWHGFVVGVALTITAGLRWGLFFYEVRYGDFRQGGYWSVDPVAPEVLLDLLGPVLAFGCGALLALRGRG